MKEHKKNLIELMKKVAYRHSLWTVYSDFLEVSAIAISNSVDILNRTAREKRYLDIISTYTEDESKLFPKMFGELVKALEDEATDVLGEIFMELDLGNKWKGQFFTPMQICRAAGELVMSDIKDIINERGFVTVSEPACGGGAMVIGYASAMKAAGFNYQKHMVVTAVDLDIKSVHMAYIQLSLLGIPAVVCHGNTLTVEVFSQWYTPIYVLDNWMFKKQKESKPAIKLEVEENGQLFMHVG